MTILLPLFPQQEVEGKETHQRPNWDAAGWSVPVAKKEKKSAVQERSHGFDYVPVAEKGKRSAVQDRSRGFDHVPVAKKEKKSAVQERSRGFDHVPVAEKE